MPDIKIGVDLDTIGFQGKLQELRAQVGMALGSATGFQSAGMAMAGTPNLGGSGFGHTFTDPQMAYMPHYGAIQAHTTMQQEAAVMAGGLAAAQGLKPPGVSPASFAMAAMSNAIERDVTARQEASAAARATFWTGAIGMGAGEVGGIAAGVLGSRLGGALGGRLFGAGGVGAGAFLGKVAGLWYGYDFAQDWAAGKVEDHFARVQQIGGVTKELGILAGGGRGLSRTEQYNLGVAARQAAGDLNMDVQQMGDVLALGREAGMMPTATDPGRAREQYRNFARAIEEGAQVLGTSLAGATQVIKQATQQGMSAQEGITQAAAAGGADVWLQQQARMNAFGAQGAAAGMGMGFTAAQGRGMFMGNLGAGAAAGLSADEMKIMGGRFGTAAFVGQTQMAMAAGPMGDLQLMAALGGGGTGDDMMGMAGAAMEGLMAGGGDFMSNIGRFMVHKNEYRRGIGSRGIRTMARQQLQMGAEMIQQFMPDLSANEAQRMYAISMGLSPDQAKLLAGGGGRGGGGRGGAQGDLAVARATMAYAGTDLGGTGVLSDAEIASKVAASPSGISWGGAIQGAATGAFIGKGGLSLPGAVAGAVVGFGVENWDAIKSVFSGGPGLFASAEQKADYYQRQAASEYDRRLKKAETEMGFIDTNEAAIQRFMGTDLSRARLNLNRTDVSGRALGETLGLARAAGIFGGRAGEGTLQVGSEMLSTEQMQRAARSLIEPISKKQRERGRKAGLAALGSTPEDFGEAISVGGQELAMGFRREEEAIGSKEALIRSLRSSSEALMQSGPGSMYAGEDFYAGVQKFAALSGDEGLQKAVREGRVFGGDVLPALETFIGKDLTDLRGKTARQMARAGGASLEQREEEYRRGAQVFVREQMLRGVGDEAIARAGVSEEEVSKRAQKIIAASAAEAKSYNAAPILAGGRTDTRQVISESAAIAQARTELSREMGGSNLIFQRKKEFSEALILEAEKNNLAAVLERGDDKKSQKAWQTIYVNTVASDPAKFASFGGEAPDLFAKREVRTGWAAMARGKARIEGYLRYGMATLSQAAAEDEEGRFAAMAEKVKIEADVKEKIREAKVEITEMTGAGELSEVGERIGKDKRTGRARGAPPLQRAAGFGAREEAMSSINRSLRHTERMLKISHQEFDARVTALEKKG